MNKSSLLKALKSAAWIALPGSFVSLLFCMLILSSGIFEMLMPVWLGIIYFAISFGLLRIPFIAKRFWIKIIIFAILLVVTVLCLHFFMK